MLHTCVSGILFLHKLHLFHSRSLFNVGIYENNLLYFLIVIQFFNLFIITLFLFILSSLLFLSSLIIIPFIFMLSFLSVPVFNKETFRKISIYNLVFSPILMSTTCVIYQLILLLHAVPIFNLLNPFTYLSIFFILNDFEGVLLCLLL